MKIQNCGTVDEKILDFITFKPAKSLFNDYELRTEGHRLDTRNSHLSDSIALTYQNGRL